MQSPFSISSSFILSFVLLPFFLNTKTIFFANHGVRAATLNSMSTMHSRLKGVLSCRCSAHSAWFVPSIWRPWLVCSMPRFVWGFLFDIFAMENVSSPLLLCCCFLQEHVVARKYAGDRWQFWVSKETLHYILTITMFCVNWFWILTVVWNWVVVWVFSLVEDLKKHNMCGK